MKLIRFGECGRERPGILLQDGTRKDLSYHFHDWNPEFFAGNGLACLQELIDERVDQLPTASVNERLGPPVTRPGKVLAIGRNYANHAQETGSPVPEEPIVFMKAANAVVGPRDPIMIPRGSTKTDWEVELGIIIGREARYLNSTTDAALCIAGYCISHDVSEREFQFERGGQWIKGKSCDTFNPIGPFLATPDEIPDIRNLALTLDVNGERMQSGNTSQMLFDVFFLVHYLSQFMTLEPGDLISTGTPPGVGMARKPPRFLREGDEVRLAIQGLGEQCQRCCQA